MSIVKGSFTDIGGSITTDTPVYQWDDTTTASTTYIRYENTTSAQYLERVKNNKLEATIGLWANRASLTSWRSINYGG